MIETIYVEEEVRDHPRTAAIRDRLPNARIIPIERYGEVFNRAAQDFRLQKRQPALILARKHSGHVLAAPREYSIGHARNFYFSHMLNCIYDCRYCFLQGMFRSAHYVAFVNYEDIQAAVDERLADSGGEGDSCFFSGYDCDSLALDAVTGFCDDFLPFFAERPAAWLELRTKSTRIDALLAREAFPNCVVAFSFTPDEMHRALEHGVPSIDRRLRAMAALQKRKWTLGLRFDPLILCEGWRERYRELFERVFATVDPEHVHSVSIGPFRLPRDYYRQLERLYPRERLFATQIENRDGMVSYPADVEAEMLAFCTRELEERVGSDVVFPCRLPTATQPEQEPATHRS